MIVMTHADYLKLCAEYATLPLIETDDQQTHADDLLEQIEQYDAEHGKWLKLWNGKPCPVCQEGTLRYGVRQVTAHYNDQPYTYFQPGAYCNHCEDGIVRSHAGEDEAFKTFRENAKKA